ncbi:MAG TPA: nucleoside-diphosphate sugar epimerase/dehydratase [Clostridia bacterium]|nr:nucleoside-diphosphate sugar epimerase/dehydratase [Clostridia bacterium]
MSRKLLLILLDAICVLAAYLATLAFRFGGKVPEANWATFENSILFIVLIYLVVNALCRLYSTLWEHASIEELLYVIGAAVASTILCYTLAVIRMDRMPRSIYIAAGLIIILLHGGLRLSYRVFRRLIKSNLFSQNKIPVLVIGAGDAGADIIRQMQEMPGIALSPVCIVDDDVQKRGVRIHGVRVIGGTNDIPAIVEKYDIKQIIYAIPSSDRVAKRRILEICTATDCELKIIPTVETMLAGKSDLRQLRDVDVGDLLERPIVKLDMDAISGYLTDSTVLVTGGGGSIGSELCRQIAKFRPKKLVVFDIYENNAYELYVDLKRIYGDELDMDVVIGSVRDIPRLDEVFGQYKPDVVFHAAAHKHVPLMEGSPVEAVKNNVNGTFNTAKAADIAGVKRFVLISTDKAVNPTNIMGATKYLCELIIQYMNQTSKNTKYVAVRFGNVLGSNGSVIPLFKRQIAMGGPVTVTHKDMKRYFMTIPEAAQLVIQAGSMAKQGEIFLLDMGEPVSIDEFARTFIRLSGYEPDVDIKVVYTGLRPGEKMFEELLQEGEVQRESDFPGILVGKTHPLKAAEIKQRIDYLRKTADEDPENIRRYMAQVVPTYCPPEEANVFCVENTSISSQELAAFQVQI